MITKKMFMGISLHCSFWKLNSIRKKPFNAGVFLMGLVFFLLPSLTIAQQTPPRLAPVDKGGLKTPTPTNSYVATSSASTGPFVLTPTGSKSNSITKIIQSLAGNGITISNIYTTLPDSSNIYGSFAGGKDVIGMESGLVMTTGNLDNVKGPNMLSNATGVNGLPGYSLAGPRGCDAAVIQFNLTSTTNIITFKYAFGSEEYNEYVGSAYNDAFAFFITGPGINGMQNIALIPGTGAQVSINTVNKNSHSQYFINNESAETADPVRFQNLEYDGITVPLSATVNVIPNATYQLTLVVQDVGDCTYDSGIFLQSGSFRNSICDLSLSKTSTDVSCNGANNGSINLTVTGGNSPFTYQWTKNGATYSNTEDLKNISGGMYSVKVTDANQCSATLDVVINEPSALTSSATPNSNGATCIGGGSALLKANGGTLPYQYKINNGNSADVANNASGQFNNLATGRFNYQVTDAKGCTSSGAFTIVDLNPVSSSILVDPVTPLPGYASNTIYLGVGDQDLTLTGVGSGGKASYAYSWTKENGDPIERPSIIVNGDLQQDNPVVVSPDTTTTYKLIVKDKNGCSSERSITITVIDVRCEKDKKKDNPKDIKVQMCHNGKAECVPAKDVNDKLKHGFTLGDCPAKSIAAKNSVATEEQQQVQDKTSGEIRALAIPNPTHTSFTLSLENFDVDKNLTIKVTDIAGRLIEKRSVSGAAAQLQIGGAYKAGVYFITVTQGIVVKTLKLVKN